MARRRPVEGIHVDPEVPKGLWSDQPKEKRSPDQLAWWGKAFIKTVPNRFFPKGIRYDVYCLDENSSDHPTVCGMFPSLEEAVQRAKEGPPWLRRSGH
jgi:hypothetical protein